MWSYFCSSKKLEDEEWDVILRGVSRLMRNGIELIHFCVVLSVKKKFRSSFCSSVR